jgi:hypothetical protein
MSTVTSNADTSSDTFSSLTLLNPGAGASNEYTMSENNIAWPGEAKKYVAEPNYHLSEIVPPPNWRARYPNGYTESNPPPNLKEDEHFQNWMRTAGLPTFTKLYSRNDSDRLLQGRYQIVINMSASLKPVFPNHFAHTRYRLPRQTIQGYEIHRHFNGFLDWREEPFPWLGLCCRCGPLCVLGRTGNHQASCSTKVRPSGRLFYDHPTHGFHATGDWETCRYCRGTGERRRTPRLVYQPLYLLLYHARSRPYSSIFR